MIGFLVGTVLPFLFVLGLVVFIHELGHYLAGRWCGIGAVAFSVGFGPEIVGFTDKRGTRWKLSVIPLGGYVRFVGDMNAASATEAAQADEALSEYERRYAFHNKSVLKRAITVFAGPFANYVLAIAIFTVMLSLNGRTVVDPVVGEVRAESAASEAGLQPGDVFVMMDGAPVQSFTQMQRYIGPRAEQPIDLVVERDGAPINLTLVPRRTEIEDRFGNKIEQGLIGIVADTGPESRRSVALSPVQAFVVAHQETWYIVARTGGYLANVITGRERADQIGGPLRVADASRQVATLGFVALLNLAAILSVSIGLLNLLPVPVLDGGHLMFYAVEAVRGRPLSMRSQEFGYRIGFALLLSLMVFATWNDIRVFLDRL